MNQPVQNSTRAKRGNTTTPWVLGGAIVAVVAIVVIVLVMNPGGTKGLKIGFPGGTSLEMDLSGETINYAAILDTLFARDETRSYAIDWLADRGFYSITDAALAEALSTKLCEPIPDEPLDLLMAKSAECAEKSSAEALRRLAEQKEPPFHFVGEQVNVGIQRDPASRPALGKANVCTNGPYLGRRVELSNPITNEKLRVQATQSYDCTGYTRFPDFQLNADDAERLFQSTLLEYQTAIAVIVT